MDLHRILGQIHAAGRPLIVFSTLLVFQQLGFLDLFLDQNPMLRVDTLNKAFVAILLIVTGRWALQKGISNIWNRLTPIKDKATYIESELCYSISTSLGTGIFCIIWLSQSLTTAFAVMGLVSLASWPAIVLAWFIQRWREKLSPRIEDIKREDIVELNEQHFWRRSFAYVIAAIVFNTSTVVSMQAILLLKTGELGNWWQLISSCSLITLIILVVFGKFIVGLGHRILNRVNLKTVSERRRQSYAYVTGYMAFLTIISGITLLAMYGSNPDSVLALWSYGVAYIVIAACAALAGVSFGYFYTPPRQAI